MMVCRYANMLKSKFDVVLSMSGWEDISLSHEALPAKPTTYRCVLLVEPFYTGYSYKSHNYKGIYSSGV